MKVEHLRVLISEDEINQYLPRALPPDAGVEKLRVRLAPEGVHLLGEYPTLLLRMSFETLWEVSVSDNRVQARLASVKVAGLPATMLRGMLLKMVRDSLAKQPGCTVENESILVDIAAILQAKQIPLDVQLTDVECTTGQIIIEAGSAE